MRKITGIRSIPSASASQRKLLSNVLAYRANRFVPGLLLDFENEYYSVDETAVTFDDAVTFSRTSNATMVDSDGLIKWAPHNLLVDSENYSTEWQLTNGASTGTITTGVSDPFGGTEAVTFTAGGNDSRFRGNRSANASFTGEVTSEVWIRRRSGSSAVAWNPCGFIGGEFITSTLTTSWQKFTKTVSVDANSIIWQLQLNSNDEVDVYYPRQYRSDLGGMVNNPDNPLDPSYVPTTDSARYLARRGHHVYNGTSWVNEGLLIESEARTNLITYSNDFANAAWSKVKGGLGTAPAVTPNYATSPDGTMNATRLEANSGGATAADFSMIKQNSTGNALGGGLWIKSNTGVDQTVFFRGAAANDSTNTAVATTEWTRVDQRIVSPNIISLAIGSRGSANGNAAIDILIYGAQVEDAPTPSSYIPTNGATATRADETVDVAAGDVPFSATGFSFRQTYTQPYWDVASNRTSTRIDTTGTNGGNINLQNREGQGPRVQFTGSVDGAVSSTVDQDGPDYSLAFRMSSSEGQLAANGTSDATPATLTSGIGDTVSTDANLFGVFGAANYPMRAKQVVAWADDIGTAGIEEITS